MSGPAPDGGLGMADHHEERRVGLRPDPSHDGGNTTLASSVSTSAAMASSRRRCRPPGSGSHQPSSVSMALYPSAASSPITLDFPVPDMPVSRTRFTAASLRSRRHRLPRGARGPARAACRAPIAASSDHPDPRGRPAPGPLGRGADRLNLCCQSLAVDRRLLNTERIFLTVTNSVDYRALYSERCALR